MVAVTCLAGCGATDRLFCSGAGCEWTKAEWARLQALSPLPETPPEDRSNKYVGNADAVALGQRFYFDTAFSGNATLVDVIGGAVPYARAAVGQPINASCATCHDPKRAGADFSSAPNTVSIGAGWYDVNGQQTVNAAYYSLLYWNGRSDSLWAQAAAVAESGVSLNGNRLAIFWTIVNNYREAYDLVFGMDWPLPAAPSTADFPLQGKPGSTAFDGMSEPNKEIVTRVFVNWTKAIAAYEYTLISRDAAFDRFIAEGPDSTWISPAAKRGAQLFVGKASCIDCHYTPLFSDDEFHDIGVPQVGDHVPTAADCPPGNAKCDCTPGGEKGSCYPSGAWAGLTKLGASLPTVNYTNFRRDSSWSDNFADPNPDLSRAEFYTPPSDVTLKGAWRTPSLRDVALTAPYMHDGVYKTLEEVVWHYNTGGSASGSNPFLLPVCGPGVSPGPAGDGGTACMEPGLASPGRAVQIKPLGLDDDEVADLVEFLKTLTGVPLEATKTSKPPTTPTDAGASTDTGTPPDTDAAVDAGSSQ